MSNVYFYICNSCRDHISNDDLSGVSNASHESAILAGAARLSEKYALSFYNVSADQSFKCECCLIRNHGDRNMYAGTPIQESGI